jgi:hypothetical protein
MRVKWKFVLLSYSGAKACFEEVDKYVNYVFRISLILPIKVIRWPYVW